MNIKSTKANTTTFNFPVGYVPFHKDAVYNFQFNRWHSFGYAEYADFMRISENIKTFDDWTSELMKLSEKAEEEGRIMNAAYYLRAAEFYIPPTSPEKEEIYVKFQSMIHPILKSDGIQMVDVPYGDGYLPCLTLKAKGTKAKDTIVAHGGFDSYREEFYSFMKYFSDNGYDVIVFDGPGQGEARRKYSIPMNYRWEKPTSAVIDHFKLDDVTLVGISMGGYLCFRAAAFDKRIKRVIASSIAYDYTDFPPKILQPIVDLFYKKLKNFTNNATLKEIKKGGMKSWYFSNLMYMLDMDKPIDAITYLTTLDAEKLHCEKITQDVLILTGRDDHAAPFKMHKKQVDALVNTNSVTDIVFTEDTHASHHCQIGNMKLNFDTMIQWIEKMS
ncbi:MAG: alpha/beta fold hydrolase [Clostridiales bacterium]|nr:alpha/beta fold hydrolase [Clostridiales bacterium]